MGSPERKSVYITCPVRRATAAQKKSIESYVARMESEGHRVYYPARDTDQIDTVGIKIATNNKEAIKRADEIHAYWVQSSTGSLFDAGMAFMARKPSRLINPEEVVQTEKDSYENVVLFLHQEFPRVDPIVPLHIPGDTSRKKVYILGPGIGSEREDISSLLRYRSGLKSQGYRPHFPLLDTMRIDLPNLDGVGANRLEMSIADEVHVYWKGATPDALFDLGMAFMADKQIRIINPDDVRPTPNRSFETLLRAMQDRSR